jgi:LysM repeat protein
MRIIAGKLGNKGVDHLKVRKDRIPSSCPIAFPGNYTVVQGDTMFLIAERLNVPLQDLIEANSHIINPNLIYPGDVLCVPVQLLFPCCSILEPVQAQPPVPEDAAGVVLIRLVENQASHALSILAEDLRSPSEYGDFDMYEGFVEIPEVGGFGFPLFPTTEAASEWAGTLTIGKFLTPSATVQVRLANFSTGASGPKVLQGNLNNCQV